MYLVSCHNLVNLWLGYNNLQIYEILIEICGAVGLPIWQHNSILVMWVYFGKTFIVLFRKGNRSTIAFLN